MPFERPLGILEEVLGIQSAVAVILEDAAMPLVRSGRGHNADLPSGSFPILSAIRVLKDVVFPHRLDAEQLGTGSEGVMNWLVAFPPTQSTPLSRNRLVSCRWPATENAGKAPPAPPAIFEVLLTTPTLRTRS